MTERAPSTEWTADDPIEGDDRSPDRLDRSGFAESAAALLQRLGERGGSSVAALIGPWGAGKSSTLNMIRARLRDPHVPPGEGWVLVDFNPWYYSDLASLQIGFFRELSAPLPATGRTIRAKLADLGQATAPLGSVLSIFGFDASNALEAVSKLIGGDQSLMGMTAAVNEELVRFGRPILVVVDDLDRLSPDELLLVFKLLRLTGRLENVHYLISFDEDTLLDALTRTGLVGESDARRAVDYLEKMIQIRLDLPPIREKQVEEWLNSGIDELAGRLGIDTASRPLRRFARAYDSLLRRRFRTPRSIRRFLAQASAFLPRNAVDIDFEDYLILAWIRAAEPLLYSLIERHRDALAGGNSHSSIRGLLRSQRLTDQREPWERRLRDAQIPEHDLDDIADILSELFPRFERQWSNQGGSAREVTGPRIGNADYFDRYFHFGVPTEDISDAVVRDAYRELSTRQPGAALSAVSESIVIDAWKVLSKLELANEEDPTGSARLLEFLLNHEIRVKGGSGIIDDHRRLRSSGAQVFLRLEAALIPEIVDLAATVEGGLGALGDWLYSAQLDGSSPPPNDAQRFEIQKSEVRFIELLEAHFDTKKDVSPLDLTEHDWAPIWDWVRLDPDGLHQWVHRRFRDGSWSPLDLLSRFVTTSVVMGVPDAEPRLRGIDFSVVDKVIGVNFLLSELASQITAVESLPLRHQSAPPSTELRREFALQILLRKRNDPGYEVE